MRRRFILQGRVAESRCAISLGDFAKMPKWLLISTEKRTRRAKLGKRAMSGFRKPETLSAHLNLQIFYILIFKQTYWPFFFLSKMMHLLPNRIRRETRHKARFEVKNKKLLCLKMADRGSNKCLGSETRVANKPDKLLAILQKVTSPR